MEENNISESKEYYINDSEEESEEKEKEDFNISYILIKIDDHLSKKKYSKIVKEIAKIERENNETISRRENFKYFIYLFEIKILCLCKLIEGKISEFYIFKKNSLFFNSKSESNKISLEKNFDRLKKCLEEDMYKIKLYINDKSIITDNMKEHIILSYARSIYLQGKYCKLKRQITDAASFFNIGINLLNKNVQKSVESETFLLHGKFLIALSSILIEDMSYIIACDKIMLAVNFFLKSLFLTIDSPNGINVDESQINNQKNNYIPSIKGLIISLFLLGICLEKIDFLDNAVILYNQSFWLFKKFYKNLDPIFFSVIEDITNRINGFKEDMIREMKKKFLEDKKREKLRLIHEKNMLKAMKLTNISNRGTFNAEKYLKMERKIRNVLINIEKRYGNKNQDGKIYLPIIKYLNIGKNNFNFTFNFLVKEKEKQIENKIKSKNNKSIKLIDSGIKINSVQNKNEENSYRNNLIDNNNRYISKKSGFNSFDDKNKKTKKVKKIKTNNTINNGQINLYKIKLQKKIFGDKNNKKFINEEIKTDDDNKPYSSFYYNYMNSKSNKANTINNKKINSLFSLYNHSTKNYNTGTIKSGQEENSYDIGDKLITNKYHLSYRNKNSFRNMNKNTINSENKEKKRQKEFVTKNSFVFCKSFKKGIQYLEKMDKREMKFQKQLLHLKNLEEDFNTEFNTINNYQGGFSKEKIKEKAEYIYLKIKDKIDDKIKSENTIDLNTINDKSKEFEKLLSQKKKLENSLIVGLNHTKIEELKKLDENLKEIKEHNFVKMLSKDNIKKNVKKKTSYSEEKVITEINNADRINHQIIDGLDNEIIKYDEKKMKFKKHRKFYLPKSFKNFNFLKYKG